MTFIHIAIAAAFVPWLPSDGSAQTDGEPSVQADADDAGFALESVSPNPFRGQTWITFRLEPGLLESEGAVTVSLRVFNILRQLVAVPALVEAGGVDGRPLDRLEIDRPGSYVAYWDGMDREGHPATAGPYFVELSVGERSLVKKILLIR